MVPEKEERGFLSTEEAGELVGFSGRQIRNFLDNGTIVGLRIRGGQWRIPRDEVERFSRERLKVGSGAVSSLQVTEPHYDWWGDPYDNASAFFITFELKSGSLSESNCWASFSVEDSPGDPFTLHWADHKYSKVESEPKYITITPDVPARLDVAFAPRRAISTPPIKPITSGIVPDLRASASKWDGRGCWIAQPFALSAPTPSMKAFLPPGEYHVRIRIYCQRDTLAFERVYLLTSPEHPEGLSLTSLL